MVISLKRVLPKPVLSCTHAIKRIARSIHEWYGGLTHYWQHFVFAVALGITIEAGIVLLHNFDPVVRTQNSVFDATLALISRSEKIDTDSAKRPVLIAIDETATRENDFHQTGRIPLSLALSLARGAFARGSRHVFLDVTYNLGSPTDEERQLLRAFVSELDALPVSTKTLRRHLYVARSIETDPCLPEREDRETLATSVWESLSAVSSGNQSNLYVHPVIPHYVRDADNVVRSWQLFSIVKIPVVSQSASWAFMPSPQLAHFAVRDIESAQSKTQKDIDLALRNLPWLNVGSAGAGAVTRDAFAHNTLNEVREKVVDGKFNRICAGSPNSFGCRQQSGDKDAVARWEKLDPEDRLARKNEALAPLPYHSKKCRDTADEVLSRMGVDKKNGTDLSNRILYRLPSWSTLPTLQQQGYLLFTPLSLQILDADHPTPPIATGSPIRVESDWSGRVVGIGATYAAARDTYTTPLGDMAGVLINLNAIQSLSESGPVVQLGAINRVLFNTGIIVVVAAIFAGVSPLLAALLSAGVLFGALGLFLQTLLAQGIWIEFGAPLIGINLHRIVDEFFVKRRLRREREEIATQHQIALQKLSIATRATAWESVPNDTNESK